MCVYSVPSFATSDDVLVDTRIFVRRSPRQRNSFSTNRLRPGYDSTLYDHYNYATSWRLLMAILLPHLIAPADCRRRLSWVLSEKRVADSPAFRAQNDKSGPEFASLTFNLPLPPFSPEKNVKIPICYKLFLCATAADLAPTFRRNFCEFSCALYNYRRASKKLL